MKKVELVFLSISVNLLSAMHSVAAEPDFVNDAPLESLLSNGTIHQGGVVRSIISLLIVIGLIYLTAWLYKNLSKFNSSKFTKETINEQMNKFNIVSSQTLGANKNLYVVEINGKYLLLGATQSNINLLKEFDKTILEEKYSILKSESKPTAQETWIENIEHKYENTEDK